MTPLGWLGAAVVGLALGLLGSGGSVLTVPILVYLLGMEEKAAIASSLVIVGGVALVGGLMALARGRVDLRRVASFGPAGILGTLVGSEAARHVPGSLQLAVFALFMLAAAGLMLRDAPLAETATAAPRAAWKVAADGAAVGVVTGFVGIGGGFLIVPALVLVGGLPMALAVGTSLLLIALNAGVGFLSHRAALLAAGRSIDWGVVGAFLVAGALASAAGNVLGARLPQRRLRRLFGVTLIGLGIFVLARSAGRLAAG